MNIYYKFWSEAILRISRQAQFKNDWKIRIYIAICVINSLNLWIIFIWLKFFNIIKGTLISVNIFPGDNLDKALSFYLMFGTPFIILNYFLIFHKNKYAKILKEYEKIPNNSKAKSAKFSEIYIFSIPVLTIITIISYSILS